MSYYCCFSEVLKPRFHDSDDTVRHTVISVVMAAWKSDKSLLSEDVMRLIEERTLDKKV